MASKDSRIAQLSLDIKGYLDSHTEKAEEYQQILKKYSSNSENSTNLLSSLTNLLQGNTRMISRVTEAAKYSSQAESNAVSNYFQLQQYIHTFFCINQTNTNKKVTQPQSQQQLQQQQQSQIPPDKIEIVRYISTILLFTIQEFLPASFINAKLKTMQSLVPHLFTQKVKEHMLQIAPMLHTVRVVVNDVYLSSEKSANIFKFFVKSSIKATPAMQFIVVARLQLKTPTHIKSLIKCLSLFGFGFIDDEYTYKWLNDIDPILADNFNCCPDVNSPSFFHPSRIYAQIMESGLTNDQVEWIFGPLMIEALQSAPSMNGDNMFESATNAEKVAGLKKSLNLVSVNIPEMKSVTFFQSMKIIINFIKNGSSLHGIEESLKCIYGDRVPSTIMNILDQQQNSFFLLKFYNRCKYFGAISHNEVKSITKKNLQTIDFFSKDWRIQYFSILKKSFLVKSLVYNGYIRKAVPKKLETFVFHFLDSFVKHFATIKETYTTFTSTIQNGGHFYCLEDFPLAIIYFIEISKMIEKSTPPLSKKELEDLPQLMFSSEPPIVKYSNRIISQIDVPASNFVKSLARFKNAESILLNDVEEMVGKFGCEYLYEIIINKNGITISSFPNYTCDK